MKKLIASENKRNSFGKKNGRWILGTNNGNFRVIVDYADGVMHGKQVIITRSRIHHQCFLEKNIKEGELIRYLY